MHASPFSSNWRIIRSISPSFKRMLSYLKTILIYYMEIEILLYWLFHYHLYQRDQRRVWSWQVIISLVRTLWDYDLKRWWDELLNFELESWLRKIINEGLVDNLWMMWICWQLYNIINIMKHRISISILLLILHSLSAQSDLKTYGPLSNEITLHGRYYIDSASVLYDWPCFKIDFCFKDSKQVVGM